MAVYTRIHAYTHVYVKCVRGGGRYTYTYTCGAPAARLRRDYSAPAARLRRTYGAPAARLPRASAARLRRICGTPAARSQRACSSKKVQTHRGCLQKVLLKHIGQRQISDRCMWLNHCFCLLQDAFKTAQDGSRTPQDGANTVSYAYKALSKGVVEAYRLKDRCLINVKQQNQCFCLLQDAFKTVQDGSKTFQDGANTVSNAHKAPSKGVVEAHRLKDSFLIDVYSKVTVFACSKTPSRRLKTAQWHFKTAHIRFQTRTRRLQTVSLKRLGLKDRFLIGVLNKVTVFACSKALSRRSRRFKDISRQRKYGFKCTQGASKRCCWSV